MDRGETLDEARKCVCEDRNKTYKEPEDNFRNIADYWNIFLDSKLGFNESITAVDVGVMMALLKIARMAGEPNDDNFVDGIGYLACACEIEGKEALRKYAKRVDDGIRQMIKEATDQPHVPTQAEKEEFFKDDISVALEYIASMGEL